MTPSPSVHLLLDEAPLALALHPAGLCVLVSTESSVRVCAIMLAAVTVSYSLPIRAVTVAAFSRSGEFVALASGNNVTILNGATLTTFVVLRGHADR